MNNETIELRIKNLEKDVEQIKTDIKPIIELQFGFRELKDSMDELSCQFKQFAEQNNSRTYEWLKYLATLIIGAVFTYIIK